MAQINSTQLSYFFPKWYQPLKGSDFWDKSHLYEFSDYHKKKIALIIPYRGVMQTGVCGINTAPQNSLPGVGRLLQARNESDGQEDHECFDHHCVSVSAAIGKGRKEFVIWSSNKYIYKLGFGSASCNASNWRASFSGYSGSV